MGKLINNKNLLYSILVRKNVKIEKLKTKTHTYTSRWLMAAGTVVADPVFTLLYTEYELSILGMPSALTPSHNTEHTHTNTSEYVRPIAIYSADVYKPNFIVHLTFSYSF